VFGWLMIGASTVFFDPDWPSRVAASPADRLRQDDPHLPPAGSATPLRRWKMVALSGGALRWC
jgi:hypothetical protein